MSKPKIVALLPELVTEIEASLRADGLEELAQQIRDLSIDRWTYDPACEGLYVHLTGQRSLNVVEQNVIGTRHGESISLPECDGMIVLDTDNFGRISGVEILNRKDIWMKLESFASRRIPLK